MHLKLIMTGSGKWTPVIWAAVTSLYLLPGEGGLSRQLCQDKKFPPLQKAGRRIVIPAPLSVQCRAMFEMFEQPHIQIKDGHFERIPVTIIKANRHPLSPDHLSWSQCYLYPEITLLICILN